MKGFQITFNIYAENEAEALKAQQDIISFIDGHARQGRAVSGAKISEALGKAAGSAFVKAQISRFLAQ